MREVKYLTRKQKDIIDDLFTGELSEKEVLEKHGIKPRTYCRWHEQEYFAVEYNRRLKRSQRQSELVFANWRLSVASKLVDLAGAQKEETARKACMDVITHPDRKIKITDENKKPPEVEEPRELPPELASRLLTALTETPECKPE